MSVTRHARLRDQAQVALAHAADIGIEGDGTPPSAFHLGERAQHERAAYMQRRAISGPPLHSNLTFWDCSDATSLLQACSVLPMCDWGPWIPSDL